MTRKFKRQSPLPLSEVCLLRGLFGSCLGLNWFIVLCFGLSCCVFLHISFSFFAKIFFSVKVIASQPVRDSGCQYQKPFSGLDCLCVIFAQYLDLPVTYLGLACGYPRAVVEQHTDTRVLSW